MDTQLPHRIIPEREIPKNDERARARYMPLTEDEAKMLAMMTADERHDWLKEKLPTKERLARHLESEGLKDLAYNARQGRYDDFDEGGEELPQFALMRDLKRKGRSDLTWIVTSGEYDATKAESDAWAKRQIAREGEQAVKRDKPNMTKLVAELAEAVTPGFGELALATDGSNVLSEAAKMIRAQRKVVKAVQRWYGDRNDGRLVEKLESDLVDAVRKYEAENES